MSLPNTKDKGGRTLLSWALGNGYYGVVKILLDGRMQLPTLRMKAVGHLSRGQLGMGTKMS